MFGWQVLVFLLLVSSAVLALTSQSTSSAPSFTQNLASSSSPPTSSHGYENNNKNTYDNFACDKNDGKFTLSMKTERDLQNRGYKYVIGSDEAGRGCIAGPVVTASCCCLLTTNDGSVQRQQQQIHPVLIPGVNDSKQLNEATRNQIFQELLRISNNDNENNIMYAWNVAQRSNVDIDASNIVKATMDSFQESIQGLVSRYNLPMDETYCIVDGNTRPKLTMALPCRAWIRGDAQVYTVALASIIAKVVRDNLMIQAHELYPQYGFHMHKGYPTRDHILAIHKYGPCRELHRMSFKPLRGR